MPKTLFFIAGVSPTEEEEKAAAAIEGALYRNASLVRDDEALEDFEALAGCVPPAYRRPAEIAAMSKPTDPVTTDPAPVDAAPAAEKKRGAKG